MNECSARFEYKTIHSFVVPFVSTIYRPPNIALLNLFRFFTVLANLCADVEVQSDSSRSTASDENEILFDFYHFRVALVRTVSCECLNHFAIHQL